MAYLKILLVDDNRDKNFFEPLADLAANYIKADLVQAYTWEEAVEILENNPYEYQAVILDGKGQKSVKSKTEDDSFLNTAKKWLDNKAVANTYIPYVIYSGFAEELRKFYDDTPIFWKGQSEEREMFTHLNEKITQSDYYHQFHSFPELFEVFNLQLLPSTYKLDFVKVAQILGDSYVGNKADVLRCLRPMLEASFKRLSELDDHLISGKYFRKGDPNISGIIFYLAGSPKFNDEANELEFHSDIVMPIHVYYITDALKKITSRVGMHHYDENTSGYLLKSVVNAFAEYIIWFTNFCKKNYLS